MKNVILKVRLSRARATKRQLRIAEKRRNGLNALGRELYPHDASYLDAEVERLTRKLDKILAKTPHVRS